MFSDVLYMWQMSIFFLICFCRHSACVMQGRIFVFGGWDTPVCFNDMFMLDLGKYCKNCYSFFNIY